MPPLKIGRHAIVPGRHYNTPKEVWGFRLGPSNRPPRELARDVLSVNAKLIGLRRVLLTLDRLPVKIKRSVGRWHVIFSQQLFGYRVHRGYVSVHMDRKRQVYLVKNRAVPHDLLPERPDKHELGVRECRRLAISSLSRTTGPRQVKDVEKVWFPVRDRLRPAVRFRVLQQRPRHEWIVYVDAARGTVLSKYDNLALASGYARVFDPNPVVALGSSDDLLESSSRSIPPSEPMSGFDSRTWRGTGSSTGAV